MTALSSRGRRPPWRRLARGLSIVELMVGITISLFILAGASMVLTTQLDSNRRLLLEAQLQQDLRTTADMISRDVRRAGYWGRAYCNVWPASRDDLVNCPVGNPYNNMRMGTEADPEAMQLEYERSTDSEDAGTYNREDNRVDGARYRPSERVGFRWNPQAGTIEYMVTANTWHTLTDPAVMEVTQFTMVMNRQDLPVPCAGAGCQAQGPLCGGPMTVQSRDLTFTIVARSVHDANVQRSLSENVRLRNSIPVEQC